MQRFQIFEKDYGVTRWIGESDKYCDAVEFAENHKFIDIRGCESTPKIYFREDCVQLPDRLPKKNCDGSVRDSDIVSMILRKVQNMYAGKSLIHADNGEIKAVTLALFDEYGLSRNYYAPYMCAVAKQAMVY